MRCGAGVLTCLLLSGVAHASGQARPDCSGKWTERDVPAGRAATTMTVSQDFNAITVDLGPDLRWTFKLDGSQSRNVTQANRRVEQFSTATWEGNKLIISTPSRLFLRVENGKIAGMWVTWDNAPALARPGHLRPAPAGGV